jgi:simple sugar transport system permease protein
MNGKAAAAGMETGGTEGARRRGLVSGFRFEFDPVSDRVPWWVPIAAVLAALAVCAVFIAANGMSPLAVYGKMLTGAFGTRFGLTETLVKTIPLLLCGVGVSIAYRISFWNIGAEGQFLAGAMAATAVTIYLPDLPAAASLPLMTLAGIAAGGVWGLMTAVPRAYFQVNELITSLMLNYVALLLLDYVVFGPWRDPGGLNFPGSPMFTAAQSLPAFGGTRLHFGLVFALAAVLLYAFLFRRTRWGYELRLIGSNPEAARNAGISLNRQMLLVMLASGGLAGLAGMAEVSGVAHRLMYGISPGYGYTAIIVAWIARLHPLGLVLSAFLFGGLIVGGYSVQTIGLPSATSEMLQGAVLFFVIAGAALGRVRIRRIG